MATTRRVDRAAALVPLALLSAAWTVSLAGVGAGSASADPDGPGTLPDGTVLPQSAIQAPASVGDSVARAAALFPGSASEIPESALAAYQRAEVVINTADTSCKLPWQLIAAIGRVESDHGRYGGNVLDTRGVAKPGIYGIALDGKNDTQRITDTDGGEYDDDTRFDRAVGPMQFIPSTWAVVGVDGDGDGTRDPQDIDDAALATAVYLCSGEDDLSTEKGQRASVYRYNHSNAYVDLVLSIMQDYLDGAFSSVPDGIPVTGIPLPDPTPTRDPDRDDDGGKDRGDEVDDQTPTSSPTTTTPTQTPTPTQSPTPTQTPTQSPTHTPTPTPTQSPTTAVPTTLPTVLPTTMPTILTPVEAATQCLAQGLVDNPLDGNDAFDQCVRQLLNP